MGRKMVKEREGKKGREGKEKKVRGRCTRREVQERGGKTERWKAYRKKRRDGEKDGKGEGREES